MILWTVREGDLLDEAVEFCRKRGLEFYAVNANHPDENAQEHCYACRKPKADLFIDDRNVGGLPDWGAIYEMVSRRISYEEYLKESVMVSDSYSNEVCSFWKRLFAR